MAEPLIVAGREALDLARALAEQRGVSIEEAVVAALRTSLLQTPPVVHPPPQPVPVPELEELTPEQRARYESVLELTRQAAAYRVPGATSDHSDLYDENGLPI